MTSPTVEVPGMRKAGSARILAGVRCPRCGNETVLWCPLQNERGEHMHTRYLCLFWGSGHRAACEWQGWTVPDGEQDA